MFRPRKNTEPHGCLGHRKTRNHTEKIRVHLCSSVASLSVSSKSAAMGRFASGGRATRSTEKPAVTVRSGPDAGAGCVCACGLVRVIAATVMMTLTNMNVLVRIICSPPRKDTGLGITRMFKPRKNTESRGCFKPRNNTEPHGCLGHGRTRNHTDV